MQERQLRTFFDAVYGDDGDVSEDRVLNALGEFIACDVATLLEIAADGGLTRHLDYPDVRIRDEAEYSAGFKAHLPECVFCARPELVADRFGVTALLDAVSSPQVHVKAPGAEGFRTVASNYALIAPLGLDGSGRLVLCRADRRFSPDERWLLGLVVPHVDRLYRQARRQRAHRVLTKRQRDVVSLLRQGCSDAQIAKRLGLSIGTVRKHLNNVYARLGVRSRAAAVARAGALADPGQAPRGAAPGGVGPRPRIGRG
jgi:DNA-binding CsgD family transcriptional regulator